MQRDSGTSLCLCASVFTPAFMMLILFVSIIIAPPAHAASLSWSYNTQLVVLSVTILGMAAGVVGSFMLLRKQSLMGDALSHATLPGIAIAFLVMVALGGSGKNLPGLLLGATITGVLGVWGVNLLSRHTRLKDDAAMGVVLSVFFGLGIAMLTVVQQMPQGSAAGLSGFIYGKTASMVQRDLSLIAAVAGVVLLLSVMLLKELTLLCFDAPFAKVQGWPLGVLETLMLALVAAVTVVGLQAVGLILILAFLITPPAAARFWTQNLKAMLVISGLIGAVSGAGGAIISARHADLPAGAVVVLVTAGLFVLSMLIGAQRGVLWRGLRRRRLNQKIGRQHLLRAMYELVETQRTPLHPPALMGRRPTGDEKRRIDSRPRFCSLPGEGDDGSTLKADLKNPTSNTLPQPLPQGRGVNTAQSLSVPHDRLLAHRSWPPHKLKREIRRAARQGLVQAPLDDNIRLTEAGYHEAARITRNHRLWEQYLIAYADIAPSHVDRDADMIEHVLSADLIRRLEKRLADKLPKTTPLPSPHTIESAP